MIKECSPQYLRFNVKEIASYLQTRSKPVTITNTARLISILKLYYETFLFYLHHSIDENTVNIKGIGYRLMFSGRDSFGNAISRPISEMSEILLDYYFKDLSKILDRSSLNDLLMLLNEILETEQIPLTQKLYILNHESAISSSRWSTIMRNADYRVALSTLEIRKSITSFLLNLDNLEGTDLEQSDDNIRNINNSYKNYLNTLLSIHLHHNHYSEIFMTILHELESVIAIPDKCLANSDSLIFHLLSRYIKYNYLFTLYKWETVIDLIEKYKGYLCEANYSSLHIFSTFNLSHFDIGALEISLMEPVFSSELTSITTEISFIIPHPIKEQSPVSFDLDNATVQFSPVNILYDDPCFSFLESANEDLDKSGKKPFGGVPISILSDSIGRVHSSTRVNIILNELYNPDFKISDGMAIYKDFKVESAKHGGKYYPHKDRIIEILLELKSSESIPIELPENEVTSRLISNYLVTYYSADKQLIHHKIYTITNLDSYESIRNRYLDSIQRLKLDDVDNSFHEFFNQTRIISKKSFLEFCYTLFDFTIKKSIEYHGLEKYFWQECDSKMIPVIERFAYPIIFNELRSICEAKGIFLGHDIVAGVGKVDFHMFTLDTNRRPINVCVEVKNAHSSHLQNGIESQLPSYIDSIGNKQGIYLVLWYRHEQYKKPKKYEYIHDIISFLQDHSPSNYDIRVMVIDCTPKVRPSKKSAGKRL